jgi:hypothetical protein
MPESLIVFCMRSIRNGKLSFCSADAKPVTIAGMKRTSLKRIGFTSNT